MINTLDISKWKLSLSSNIGDASPSNGYIKYYEQGSSIRIAVNTTNNASIDTEDLLVNYDVLLNTEDLYVSLVQLDDGSKYRTGFITNITFTSGTTALIEATLLDSSGSLTNEATYSLLVNNRGAVGNQGYQGHQGHPGVAGTQGTQGYQGQQGYQGYQGHQGVLGLKGLQGYQGFQGNPGFPGDPGPQGGPGPQGPQGDQGVQGPQGLPGGPQGYQGVQGIQGRINYTGYGGSRGVQGPQGYQGFQGPHRGYQGNPGQPGVQGSQGPQGGPGPQGPQGVQGYQGERGNSGHIGHQGPQGPQGNQGFQGDEGFVGSQGIQGTQGPQGFQGPQGYQGNQGLSVTGPQGTQGNQGFQGSQGFQGPQGYQGNQGLGGGPQGAQGPQGTAGNTNSYTATLGNSSVNLLLHFSGSNGSTTFKDDSYNNFTSATFSGAAVISTAQSKFGGSSLYLNGSNASSFKFVNTSNGINFTTGDFTIEMWFYRVASVAWISLINFNTSAWYQGPVILINNVGQLYLENSYGGSNKWTLNTGWVPSLNQWHHIAVVGTTGQHVKFYVNGTLYATRNGSYTFSMPSGGDIYLGNSSFFPSGIAGDTGVRTLNGYIDEVRISSVARYSADFTPSVSQFPNAGPMVDLPANPSVGTIVHTSDGVYACSSTSPMTWKKYAITPRTLY